MPKIESPINKMWESYRKHVVPQGAPPTQIVDTQRAFFAGAATLFQFIMTALESGDDATESDLALMDEVQRELRAFGQGLDSEFFKQSGTA